MKIQVQGSAVLQCSSQFLCCQPLKASLHVMESPQPPAWANPVGREGSFAASDRATRIPPLH